MTDTPTDDPVLVALRERQSQPPQCCPGCANPRIRWKREAGAKTPLCWVCAKRYREKEAGK